MLASDVWEEVPRKARQENKKTMKRKRSPRASPAATAAGTAAGAAPACSPSSVFTPPRPPAATAMRGLPLLAAGVPLPSAAKQERAQVQAPQQEQRERQAAPEVLTEPVREALPWQAAHLSTYLRECLQRLSMMFSQCEVLARLKVDDMARVLFRQTYHARPAGERAAIQRDETLARALLTACLTLAIKFAAPRPLAPSHTLMRRVTGLPLDTLVAAEQDVLSSLGWRLMPAAREAGVVPPAEEEEQEQATPALAPEPPAAASPAEAADRVLAQLVPEPARRRPGLLEALLQSQQPMLAAYAAAAAATPSNLLPALQGAARAGRAPGVAPPSMQAGCQECKGPGSDGFLPGLAPPPSSDLVRLMASAGL